MVAVPLRGPGLSPTAAHATVVRLTMRTIFTMALLIPLLGVIGCNRITSSGIPSTLKSDIPCRQQATLKESS